MDHFFFGANGVVSYATNPPTDGPQQEQHETHEVPNRDKRDKEEPYDEQYGGNDQQ
jgi:hypothetical protein